MNFLAMRKAIIPYTTAAANPPIASPIERPTQSVSDPYLKKPYEKPNINNTAINVIEILHHNFNAER
ncbi:hypothetical protein EMIT0111MI5_250066 [Burkholderia sp. IT-111MI5]